jgi:hypothetical protein
MNYNDSFGYNHGRTYLDLLGWHGFVGFISFINLKNEGSEIYEPGAIRGKNPYGA